MILTNSEKYYLDLLCITGGYKSNEGQKIKKNCQKLVKKTKFSLVSIFITIRHNLRCGHWKSGEILDTFSIVEHEINKLSELNRIGLW